MEKTTRKRKSESNLPNISGLELKFYRQQLNFSQEKFIDAIRDDKFLYRYPVTCRKMLIRIEKSDRVPAIVVEAFLKSISPQVWRSLRREWLREGEEWVQKFVNEGKGRYIDWHNK